MDEDVPLKTSWTRLYDEVDELENREEGASDRRSQERIVELSQTAKTCDDRIRAADLFSNNEEIDDVQTPSLPYLLNHYVQGRLSSMRLCMKEDGTGIHANERIKTLKRASIHFTLFLRRARELRLARAGPDAAADDETAHSGTGSREAKIARYAASKDTKLKLGELNAKLRRIQRLAGEDDEIEVDEDVRRDLWLLRIDLALDKALDDLDYIEKEIEMLQIMAMRSTDDVDGAPSRKQRELDRRVEPSDSAGIEVTRVEHGADGALVSTRSVVKADVFKARTNGPTMTLEEFADLEMDDALRRAEKEKNASRPDMKQKALHENGLEDDVELMDKAAVRDRNWDDWKDDNPKGSGVTNRY